MTTVRRTLFAGLVLAALLIPVQVTLAKGPPSKITISGPGIEGEIEITDPEMLEPFSFYQFNDLERRTDAPADPGTGYTITRYILDNDGAELIAWDTLTYYPREGELGLIYFDGLNPEFGATGGQGMWYLATPEGDAAMRDILAGASPGSAAPSAASSRVLTLGPLAALAGLIAAAAGLRFARTRSEMRALRQP